MKRTFTVGFNWILLLLITASCVRSPLADNNSQQFQIPWPDESGEYQLQSVSIPSLTDRDSLKSNFVNILIQPTTENNQIVSETPVGRFALSDNTWVPLDYTSLQAATVFAHQDRLAEIDKQIGVYHLQDWPIHVALDVRARTNGQLEVNNAIYNGYERLLYIVPYTEAALPISFNAGILAHEHFHSIFHSLVQQYSPDFLSAQGLQDFWDAIPARFSKRSAQKDSDLTTQETNTLLLRGLNEGIADYWAWMYTGDVDFIGKSLRGSALRRSRSLEGERGRVWSQDVVKRKFGMCSMAETDAAREGCRIMRAYEFGTEYARFLRSLSLAQTGDASSRESRIAFAKQVVAALQIFKSNIVTVQKNGTLLSGDLFVKPMTLQMTEVTKEACETFGKFLESGSAESKTLAPKNCQPSAPPKEQL